MACRANTSCDWTHMAQPFESTDKVQDENAHFAFHNIETADNGQ